MSQRTATRVATEKRSTSVRNQAPRKELLAQLVSGIDHQITFLSDRMDSPILTRADKLVIMSQLHRLSIDRSELQLCIDGLGGKKLHILQEELGRKMQSGVTRRK